MYDPDSKREKSQRVTEQKPEPPKTVLVSQLMPEQQVFRYYLLQSASVREAFGIGIRDGRPVILDKSKIDRAQGWQKDVLRQVWKELGGAEIKKEGSNAPLPT